MKKEALLSMSLCFILTVRGMAQSIGPSVLNSTGGTAAIGSNTYEWSVGEMTLVGTFAGTGISVTQGVLQPVQNTTGIAGVSIGPDELRVYPVPATDALYIRPAFTTGGTLCIALLDASGKTVSRKITNLSSGTELQELNVGTLAAGNYLLQIAYETGSTSKQQSYKIQKAH